tara:strand:- start:63 stop:539 length:477 start_codon:yes stop_codon:yes gene_type:complete
MKLCDFCGFVIKEQDAKCSNCRMMVPGREAMFTPHKVEAAKLESKSPLPHRGISSYIPKKLIALLLVVGLFASPQTQVLISDGIDYWDEINTPYYTIPVKYEVQGNFLSYLKFKRLLSKSKKMLNFDKESIKVIKGDSTGAINATGTLTIVGLTDEFS